MKNSNNNKETGFILVILILLIPFLFSITLTCIWSIYFAYHKQRVETLCYREVLKAQGVLIKSAEQLLSLNPIAKKLKMDFLYWKMLQKVPHPATRALATAKLQGIRIQQKILHTKQRNLLKYGHSQVKLIFKNLTTHLKDSFKDVGKPWSQKHPRVQLKAKIVRPQLTPKSKGIAPLYRRKLPYSQRQQLSITWSTTLFNNFPYASFTKLHQSTWTGACYSHPRKKGTQWFANLGRAKF